MKSNCLQLNTAQTEVMCCTSVRRQHQLPTVPLPVGNDLVMPVSSVRDLDIRLDADFTMQTHVTKTAAGCFAALRQIRSICRSVSPSVLRSLVASLLLSRQDYGCSTLAGLLNQLLGRRQSVLNEFVRVCHATIRGRACSDSTRSAPSPNTSSHSSQD